MIKHLAFPLLAFLAIPAIAPAAAPAPHVSISGIDQLPQPLPYTNGRRR